MIIIRLLALGLWVLAALALAGDAWTMTQTGEFLPKNLGKRWFELHGESLTMTQNLVERYISPEIWNPGVVTVLSWPAWAVLAGLAVVFTILSARRRR